MTQWEGSPFAAYQTPLTPPLTQQYPVSPGPLPLSAAGPHFHKSSFCPLCIYGSLSCCSWHLLPDSTQGGFDTFLTMSVCSDSVSIFLTDYLTLIPLSVYFIFRSEFCQELPVNPHRPPGIFAWLPVLWNGLFLRRWSLNITQLSWTPLAFRVLSHGTLSSGFLKRPKPAVLKARVVVLVFCLALSSQDPEFYHLLVAGSKAAFDFHNPN